MPPIAPVLPGAQVITHPDALAFELSLAPPQAPFGRALLVDPEHYDITYVINPHMAGNVGRVDRVQARQQWEALRQTIESLGRPVEVLPGVPGLPDMVFAANQSFPARLPDGTPAVVLSRMASPQRRPEVAYFEAWHAARGTRVLHLDAAPEAAFEGTGDASWVPGHRLVVAAHGFRTDAASLQALATGLQVPVLALTLVDPRFYHIDTCLQFLDTRTALLVEEAFAPHSVALLRAAIPNLIPVPLAEGVENLACNGWCLDGRHYVVQAGSPQTRARVRAAGFEVVEVDTSQFILSGGSVYCMKLEID